MAEAAEAALDRVQALVDGWIEAGAPGSEVRRYAAKVQAALDDSPEYAPMVKALKAQAAARAKQTATPAMMPGRTT